MKKILLIVLLMLAACNDGARISEAEDFAIMAGIDAGLIGEDDFGEAEAWGYVPPSK